MRATDFRRELYRRLERSGDQIVLRVLLGPSDSAPVELSGGELLARSLEIADKYSNVPEKGVVLLLLPHSVELFLLHLGLVLRGRLPAILAWPTNRVDPIKYQRNLRHQLSNLPASQLLTLPRLAGSLDPYLPYQVTACSIMSADHMEKSFQTELEAPEPGTCAGSAVAHDRPEDALFLQFSGGTTGAQKCVVVTAEMLESQLRLLAQCLEFGSSDSVVSWLPLYHDMGLIACLWLPLWSGATSIHLSAQDWLMDPGILLRLMERFRSTFCWLPNFAFSYLAAQRRNKRETCSLGHVRAWINCSEPVRQRCMTLFAEAFAKSGVRPEQCQASYAMAENVFAVTQTVLGQPPLMVPRAKLSHYLADVAELRYGMLDDVFVSSGKTLKGMEVRICKSDGNPAAETECGGIEIRTQCMFGGYWGNNGFQRQALTSDGWYITGDYGFVQGQDLFVIGRTKDIVIVGGQNVFPEDVEILAGSVSGVYPGRVAVFGIDDSQQGTEALVVIAEMRGQFDAGSAHRIELEIHRLVVAAIGIAPRIVRVVPERWIVKSTAGKISRRETRLRFLEEMRITSLGRSATRC
jgi:acyl-CoA synthetase (AMP-forming)/AMP-acid ligase II